MNDKNEITPKDIQILMNALGLPFFTLPFDTKVRIMEILKGADHNRSESLPKAGFANSSETKPTSKVI